MKQVIQLCPHIVICSCIIWHFQAWKRHGCEKLDKLWTAFCSQMKNEVIVALGSARRLIHTRLSTTKYRYRFSMNSSSTVSISGICSKEQKQWGYRGCIRCFIMVSLSICMGSFVIDMSDERCVMVHIFKRLTQKIIEWCCSLLCMCRGRSYDHLYVEYRKFKEDEVSTPTQNQDHRSSFSRITVLSCAHWLFYSLRIEQACSDAWMPCHETQQGSWWIIVSDSYIWQVPKERINARKVRNFEEITKLYMLLL